MRQNKWLIWEYIKKYFTLSEVSFDASDKVKDEKGLICEKIYSGIN